MKPGRVITVYDVLYNVYNASQTPVTWEEWGNLSAEERIGPNDAYMARINKITPLTEQMKVIRRVDFLGGWCWFGGIVQTATAEVFELHTRFS